MTKTEISQTLDPQPSELALYSIQLWNQTLASVESRHLEPPLLVSFLAREPLGSPVGGILIKHSFGVIYVESFFVLPGYQRRGIGKQLTEAAFSYGRSKDCSHVLAQTYDFHTALEFLNGSYADIQLVGKIENCPPPFTLYFFKKNLGN
ncbi:MAG: GNAT family N-acetyltransferase [Deltaproteobacteria bacterium]|jgi:GNAT superfamily N-acetyltransferase|nr:GNAT family N-acetyltransferase [Deltaproteobacteria bacterium]